MPEVLKFRGISCKLPILCITTISILTLNPRLALSTARATIMSIWQNDSAPSIAATLPKAALAATCPAVVVVAKNITTCRFAAKQLALPFVGRDPIAHINRMAISAFLYNVGQETTSRLEVWNWVVEYVVVLLIVFMKIIVVWDGHCWW